MTFSHWNTVEAINLTNGLKVSIRAPIILPATKHFHCTRTSQYLCRERNAISFIGNFGHICVRCRVGCMRFNRNTRIELRHSCSIFRKIHRILEVKRRLQQTAQSFLSTCCYSFRNARFQPLDCQHNKSRKFRLLLTGPLQLFQKINLFFVFLRRRKGLQAKRRERKNMSYRHLCFV